MLQQVDENKNVLICLDYFLIKLVPEQQHEAEVSCTLSLHAKSTYVNVSATACLATQHEKWSVWPSAQPESQLSGELRNSYWCF